MQQTDREGKRPPWSPLGSSSYASVVGLLRGLFQLIISAD